MVEVDTITLAEISVTHSRWQLNTTGKSGATKLDNRTQWYSSRIAVFHTKHLLLVLYSCIFPNGLVTCMSVGYRLPVNRWTALYIIDGKISAKIPPEYYIM